MTILLKSNLKVFFITGLINEIEKPGNWVLFKGCIEYCFLVYMLASYSYVQQST